jgi:DNA-binding CsgD family transcriptional regulator
MSARRLRAIAGDLATVVDGGAPALEWLVPAVRDALGADKGFGWSCAPFEADHVRLDVGIVDRIPREFVSYTDAWMSRQHLDWTNYNPLRPEPGQRNVALTLHELPGVTYEQVRSAPIVRDVYPRFGLQADEQLRVLLCDGSSLLAWVGISQSAPITLAQKRGLQRLVGAMRRRLGTERLLREAGTTRVLLDAAFEAIAAPAFVLGETGRVLDANRAGAAWLSHDRARRAPLLARAARDEHAREGVSVTKIVATGAPVRFLAVLSHHDAAAAHVLHASVTRWGFTRREAQVFGLLSRGKPNRAIAAELAISERTVETHLTSMFEKAQVASRAELLVRAMRGR